MRRALLQERANPFLEVWCGKQLIAECLRDCASVLRVGSLHLLDERHAGMDGDGGEAGDPAGDFEGAVDGIGVEFVDEDHFVRFGGIEDAAGESEFERAAIAHGGGDGAVDEEGPDGEADFGESEGGFGSGDDDVTVGDESGAAAESGSVDGGDDRGGEADADGEEALVDGVEFRCGNAGFDLGKVHAGAEDVAVGGEEDGADSWVAIGGFEGVGERGAEGGVEGVAFVGTVEGKAKDASFADGMKKIGHCTGMRRERDAELVGVDLIICPREERWGKGRQRLAGGWALYWLVIAILPLSVVTRMTDCFGQR